MRFRTLGVMGFCLAVVSYGAFAEVVDNPNYRTWQKSAVSRFVNHRVTISKDGQVTKAVVTSTLRELTDDKAAIETVTTVEADGKPKTVNRRITELKKLAERDQANPSTVDAAKLANAATETITVPAGKFETKVVKIDDAKQGVSGTIWFSADVPNGMVKMELHFKAAEQDIAAELLKISPEMGE